ncbi:MAG: MarR family winged helix-turn-helix transcriptional regulator [Anaerolineae bacterium]
MVEKASNLRFDGSVWCNLDIALRNVDQVFQQVIRPLNLTVIEWYILRALYDTDGQHASELARAVGRAATSFTPNLDKLQKKGLIERRPDTSDRRAVRIFLTEAGQAKRNGVLDAAEQIDQEIASMFQHSDFEAFLDVLNTLQTVSLE